jgi:AcrR family transcriptional regulator
VTATEHGRRAATKAANRAAILDAARDVFADAGYGAASVRDIVRRTELASGTFYNYFPDKASIFRALVEDVAAEGRRRTRAARRGATTVEGFVEDGYRAFFAFMVEDPARLAFLARNAGTIREQFGEAVLPAGVSDLGEDLEAAIAAGAVPAVDVDYCAHAMIALGLELGQRLVLRDPPDVDGATAFASALFLGGLERMSGEGSEENIAPPTGQMADRVRAAMPSGRQPSTAT